MIVCGKCRVVMKADATAPGTVWVQNTKTEHPLDVVVCPVCRQSVFDVSKTMERYAHGPESGVLPLRLDDEPMLYGDCGGSKP